MQTEPRAENIKHEYEAASPALKKILCKWQASVLQVDTSETYVTGFTLELAWDCSHLALESEESLHPVKLGYQHRVMSDRAEARAWDAEGRALGLW